MSAMQNGTLSVEDCDFTLGADSSDQEELIQDMRKILDNLRDQKEQLQKQQAGLRATLVMLTNVIKNGKLCKKCQNNEKVEVKRDEARVRQPLEITSVCEPPSDPEDCRMSQGVDFEYFDEDRICPLCSQFFHRTVKFDDFNKHVLTHFSEEEVDFDSLAPNNFELVN